MSQKFRYVALIEVCITAEDDLQANEEAEAIAEELRRQYDNQASVTSLVQPPVRGVGDPRMVYEIEKT